MAYREQLRAIQDNRRGMSNEDESSSRDYRRVFTQHRPVYGASAQQQPVPKFGGICLPGLRYEIASGGIVLTEEYGCGGSGTHGSLS